ncbi:Dienelactone hydrolase [Rhodospirillales bacterium URHD0017]|nr:Dienelactone hydrolase [Rhodospirillales bacterium URHD0017]
MASMTLDYRDGDVALKGVLVRDEKWTAGPAIVLFPDARGIGAHALECAGRLAALDYPTLVADLYGEGVQARDMTQAGELMRSLRADVDRWRARARASLDALSRQEGVDRSRLVALGYCFGGSTALELARSGAPLAAVVSFHGGLASPRPADAANIKAKVLVCHGAADPLVPPTDVAAFEEAMGRTKVDWQLHAYGGAVHAFTNPDADNAGTPALGYNEAADRRSWVAMLGLLKEAFTQE